MGGGCSSAASLLKEWWLWVSPADEGRSLCLPPGMWLRGVVS